VESALPVELDHESDVFGATTELARRWRRMTYDALYLELAQRRGPPLATLDGGLRQPQAAQGMGIVVAAF